MEEIRRYIESGILELYVLGDLSASEKAEIESMAAKYPEVKEELNQIEITIGELAESYAVEPSKKVKTDFFNNIEFNSSKPQIEKDHKKIIPVLASSEKEEALVTSINQSRLNFYKYSFAACLGLLILSIAALFTLYNNLQESKQQLIVLQSSNQNFANQVNFLETKVDKTNEALTVYSNPDFKIVELKGTANSPESKMMVAFNPAMQKVMIDMKNMNMPVHDENHQYQLWALVDGKPVDLGVFDADKSEIGLKNMKSLEKAQAFAVTLEPKGGSVNPTMDKMMVMGAI